MEATAARARFERTERRVKGMGSLGEMVPRKHRDRSEVPHVEEDAVWRLGGDGS